MTTTGRQVLYYEYVVVVSSSSTSYFVVGSITHNSLAVLASSWVSYQSRLIESILLQASPFEYIHYIIILREPYFSQ